MNEVLFVERREPDWKRLNWLTARADASPTNLNPDELEEFIKLYKRVSGDLAKVRTQSANIELIEFLNDLCSRAYGVIYRAPRANLFVAVANGIKIAARTARKRWACLATSAGVLIASGIFSYLCIELVPETKDYFIPSQMADNFKKWRDGAMEDRSFGDSMAMTGVYMGNNPRAAIMTGGIAASTFGIGSAALVFMNGALLGSLTHELAQVGRVGYLYARIMPHGVTEFSGLIFSGASGFVMGLALIRPGRKSRGEALKEAGKDALILLATAITLMFIAAPIEGFFSFNPVVPTWLKVVFASASAVAWGMFWYGFGREERA